MLECLTTLLLPRASKAIHSCSYFNNPLSKLMCFHSAPNPQIMQKGESSWQCYQSRLNLPQWKTLCEGCVNYQLRVIDASWCVTRPTCLAAACMPLVATRGQQPIWSLKNWHPLAATCWTEAVPCNGESLLSQLWSLKSNV